MNKIIFFGNGPLADHALEILAKNCEIIFHAHTKEDLQTALSLKAAHPDAHGILASYGVIIKPEVLNAFEPEGILNIHPSLLPKYRGPSPIESAILNGDTNFSVSIMKLAPAMDAGPVYYQTTLNNLPLNKSAIYQALSQTAAHWLAHNINSLPTPVPQDENQATYTQKFTKSDGLINPESETASSLINKIIAFAGFPKVKCPIAGINCTILKAHRPKSNEKILLPLPCKDGILSIDQLQPDGKKPMDAKSFLNGYKKPSN